MNVLNAGSLPAALDQRADQRLLPRPTLGQDTIQQSTRAMIIASILVPLFMLCLLPLRRHGGRAGAGVEHADAGGLDDPIKAAFTLPGLPAWP